MKKVMIWAGPVLAILIVGGVLFLRSMGMFASDPVYATGNGAIDGYDPVAYFQAGEPVKGKQELSHQWNGADWHFSSQENLALFRANPEKYAPAFGGYCAFAVASGYTAKTDPQAFAIVNDRLYLNFDPPTQKDWIQDQKALIAAGQQNWPGVLVGH